MPPTYFRINSGTFFHAINAFLSPTPFTLRKIWKFEENVWYSEYVWERRSVLKSQSHPFHVLSASKLPIFIALVAGLLALAITYKLHNADAALEEARFIKYLVAPFFSIKDLFEYHHSNLLILFLIGVLVILMLSWAYRLLKEGRHQTKAVQLDFKHGVLLFLVSEAMLFFPFFWSFFHGALSPSIAIGGVWPPIGIKGLETLNPLLLPLVNTIVLLCSGVAVVCAHRALIHGYRRYVTNSLFVAISFGILFSWLQFM